MKNKTTIELIQDCVEWLDENKKATNMVQICQTIDRLAVLTVTVGHDVATAYEAMNTMEDDYKIAFAKAVSESSESVAKAERSAEVATADLRRNYTQAKNAYKRLQIWLDRIDRVIESYRQLISVSKLDLKHN
jgi:PHD/YefM family antitoxin component YafN of YafNO toxin-antitoxin module